MVRYQITAAEFFMTSNPTELDKSNNHLINQSDSVSAKN